MINKVILTGRLVDAPELRYTPSNKAVATARIACPRDFKNQNGERESDFFPLVIWGKQGENFADWLKKGFLVTVEGRLQTRSYENQQGQRVYVTEVVADNFQILESRATREGQSNSYNAGGNNNFGGNNFSSQGSSQSQTPNFARDESPFGDSNPMDISDDDLPF